MRDPRHLIEARFGHLPFTPPESLPEAEQTFVSGRCVWEQR